MAAATRRFRPDDDWTQTKITTRPSPPKEPRDERVRIPRPLHVGAGVTRRPVPVDVKLAQAKQSVRLVSNGQICDDETLRDPEIVDLAPSSRPWMMTRHEICAPPYPPPPPPKPKRSLRGVPSVASRQSEMSFGILDYYIHAPSPLQSPALPTEAKTAVDPAIERFDFGLQRESVETSEATSGADDEMQLIPLSPRPFEEEKSETGQPQAKKYSLFPAVKEATPLAHRLAQAINDSPTDSRQSTDTMSGGRRDSSWRPRLLSGAKLNNTPTPTRRRADTISSSTQATPTPKPTTTIPSPSYHPRNPSLSFSTTSRLPSISISSGSGSSTRDSRRIPLRILSSSSSATTNTFNTTSRSSISTSPGSTIAGQQKPLLSRWSEDTALASPTTAAAVLGCRSSFGSLIGGEISSGEAYPACFFEDDEDVPLRRRKAGRGKGWRSWLCCSGKG
jgi:hypothetical protein